MSKNYTDRTAYKAALNLLSIAFMKLLSLRIVGILLWMAFLGTPEAFCGSAPTLNGQKIIGVELWIADSSDAALESTFGHSLLRFVSESQDPLEDIMLSFEAAVDFNDPTIKQKWNGIVGNYPTIIKPIQLIDVLMEYAQINNRGFSRVPLRMSNENITKLVQAAQRVAQGALVPPNYKFINFNCASALIWFFTQARVVLHTPDVGTILPTQLPAFFKQNLLAPWGSFNILAGASVLEKIKYKYTYKQKAKRAIKQFDISKRELLRLPKKEVYILAVSNYPYNQKTKDLLEEILKDFNMDTLEIYGIKSFPAFFYQDSVPFDTTQVTPDISRATTADSIDHNLIKPHQHLKRQLIPIPENNLPSSVVRSRNLLRAIINECRSCDLVDSYK